jgi:thiol-disulfide isomerase/thioredoxin
MRQLYSFAIITLIVGTLIVSPSGAQATRAKSDTVKDTVSNFKLQNIAGGSMTNADFKGKVTVFDLFATWCGPCISEIPKFNKLNEAYQGKDVAIIGIVTASPGRNIASRVQQLGIKYPVLVDDGNALAAFGDVEAFPTTIVVDRQGKIYKRYRGAAPNKQENIKKDIERLLSEESGG